MNTNKIVLISGGIDSTILATRAAHDNVLTGNKTLLLHISYDHPAREVEEIASFNVYKHINDTYKNTVEYKCVKVPIIAKSMFIGNKEKGARVVPNRNSIMLNIAINVAVCNDVKIIEYGAVLDDLNDYVDCRKEFLDKMNDLASDWGVKIEAPLMNLNKSDVLYEIGSDVSLIHCSSCYEPKLYEDRWVSCGECNSCISNGLSFGYQQIVNTMRTS
tara:strand:- start:3397 stop:4047 length:651 start_codon:yes stop_codon:yes gene_type:complete